LDGMLRFFAAPKRGVMEHDHFHLIGATLRERGNGSSLAAFVLLPG